MKNGQAKHFVGLMLGSDNVSVFTNTLISLSLARSLSLPILFRIRWFYLSSRHRDRITCENYNTSSRSHYGNCSLPCLTSKSLQFSDPCDIHAPSRVKQHLAAFIKWLNILNSSHAYLRGPRRLMLLSFLSKPLSICICHSCFARISYQSACQNAK